jgi:hypothetical protein
MRGAAAVVAVVAIATAAVVAIAATAVVASVQYGQERGEGKQWQRVSPFLKTVAMNKE